MTTTYMVLIGFATLIATLVGVYVTLRKYGPEVNKLQVDTSQSLVAMAEITAKMHAADAADLRARNKDLDDRVTAYASQMGEAMARIAKLEEKAAQVDALTAENARLTSENQRLRRERNVALEDVRKLEARVELLEQTVEWRQVPSPHDRPEV